MCCSLFTCCCASLSCCCAPCKSCGVHEQNYSKVAYVTFQLSMFLTAVLVMLIFKPLVDVTEWIGIECPDASGGSSSCLGLSGLVRMSFVLALFHIIVLLCSLCRTGFSAVFHDGCWFAKIIIVLGSWVATFWMPNSSLAWYLSTAKWVSTAYLVFQALLVMALALKIDMKLCQQAESGSACSQAIVLIVFIGLTVGGIVFSVYQYIWFNGCTDNLVVMIVSSCFMALFYIASIARLRPDATVITTSFVFWYLLYIQQAALSSNEDVTCNPYLDSEANTVTQILFGLFFVFASLYVASDWVEGDEEEQNIAEELRADIEKEELKDDGKEAKEEVAVAPIYKVSDISLVIQAILVFSSMYMCMLLTNWGTPTLFNEETTQLIDSSGHAYWIKVAAGCWPTILFMIVFFAAPALTDREFKRA